MQQLVPKDVAAPSEGRLSNRSHTDDFAVVIGIDDYPSFRPLKGAVADATAFRDWLCDPAGGGLRPEHVKFVTSTPTPTPEQKHIDQVIEELIVTADRNEGGRRLYFYFSGHGAAATDAMANVALLLADWSKKRARLGLSSQSYANDLASYGLFEELAVFLDCCRTESTPIVGLACTLTPTVTTAKTVTRNFVAYAAEFGQSAFERPDGELWQGVFTRCLLQILKRSGGGVTAGELKDLLEREVTATHGRQKAHVENSLLGSSRFGIHGEWPRLEITFSPYTIGPVRLFDGFQQLVGDHDPAAGRWTLQLKSGLYKLVDSSERKRVVDFPAESVIEF
ncbi:MAG: caspase family protein [Kofleriaceae bacterium]